MLIFIQDNIQNLLLLLSILLITWHKGLKGGYLIDDDQGLAQFSDKWRPEQKDAKGEIITELKVDYYNEHLGKDKDGKEIVQKFKNLQYNPHLGIPGAFMRWHRLQIGKRFTVIGKNKLGHEIYGFIQDPFRHHLWSLFLHSVNCILVYIFLEHLFGSRIALFASVLFSIHPVASQCVAWISGINYQYSLLFSLSMFILNQHVLDHRVTIPFTVLLSALSSMTLLPGCMSWIVLLLLGRPWEAFSSLLASTIVFFRDGLGAVSYRKKNFKEQGMASSTFFSLRKPIVMLKTLWYYTKLMIYPSKLGLYHEYGYHYDEKMERFNLESLNGLIVLSLMVYFAIQGPFLITFSIIWMLIYWVIFSNIITANQFVVERYIFIPSLGYALILAHFLHPYPTFLWFLIALYMSRSMSHLWTFRSQKDFYLSNSLNFRNSEVALGNLGVVYINEGKAGSAIETWLEATKINPMYDVSWYNLYSIMRSNGNLSDAKKFLEGALRCKTIHFKERWEQEMKDLDGIIAKAIAQQQQKQPIVTPQPTT